MNEQQYRDVLLAKAIETQPPPPGQAPLLSDKDVRQATERTLRELRLGKGGARQLERLAVHRADLLLRLASHTQPAIGPLRRPRRAASLLWWLPLLALLLGFATEKIAEPHRLNLMAWPLLAIVFWNLAMYVVMAVLWLRRLLRPRRPGEVDELGLEALRPVTNWWTRSALGLKDKDGYLRTIYQRFMADWMPYSHARHARVLRSLTHLCAAALAIGVGAALWFTGMFAEYRVGWESTWLTPQHMHTLAHWLSWPAQTLLGMPAWSLEQIEQLQSWPAGQQQNGRQWIIAYSTLLALTVVLPRVLLAVWNWVAALGLSKTLHLPLDEPYFQKIARDFSSDATTVAVHPFSMVMNNQRQQQVVQFVQQHFGAAAHVHFAPTLEYGEGEGRFAHTLESAQPHLQALLFNMAATPEEETHGAALAQFEAHVPGARGVWLYGHEFAQRLGDTEAARHRIAERSHLWQVFVESHGMQAQFIGLPAHAAQAAAPSAQTPAVPGA